jgi:hypothetical protein
MDEVSFVTEPEPRTRAEALALHARLLTELAADLQIVAGRLAKLAILVTDWAAQVDSEPLNDADAQDRLDQENYEASIAPEGPKEYWRAKMVGHYTYGADHHVMTDAEFENDWDES